MLLRAVVLGFRQDSCARDERIGADEYISSRRELSLSRLRRTLAGQAVRAAASNATVCKSGNYGALPVIALE